MIDILYKFVRKLIIPHYPWIKDVEWRSRTYEKNLYFDVENKKFWSLWVYVDRKDFESVETKEFNELRKDVKSLYEMVGMPENEIFDDVVFYYKD